MITPTDEQVEAARRIAKALGFDFDEQPETLPPDTFTPEFTKSDFIEAAQAAFSLAAAGTVKPLTAEEARNELARREDAGHDARVPLTSKWANVPDADLRSALVSQPHPEAVAVAWQHRIYYEDTDTWSDWRDGKSPPFDNKFESRSLYLHPAPTLQGAGLIEALTSVRKSVKNARGAIESNQVTDKDVHGMLTRVLATIDAALSTQGAGLIEAIPAGAIRVCPERDGKCPHGATCPYTIDRYHCDIKSSRAALSPQRGAGK